MTAPGPKPEITAPQQQEGGAQVALATVARSPYHDRLAIAQRLTATYPSNTQWQLDLAVVYDRVGNVLVASPGPHWHLCVPKIRSGDIGDEARQGQVVM